MPCRRAGRHDGPGNGYPKGRACPYGAGRTPTGLEQPWPQEARSLLRAAAAKRPVTLLTATRELDVSQAVVLAGLLRETT